MGANRILIRTLRFQIPGRPLAETAHSDDESLNDCGSLAGSATSNNATADDDAISRRESLLRAAIDQTTEKSLNVRVAGMTSIAEALQQHYMPDCVAAHRATLIDVLERALRRGKGDEQQLAAQLVTLVVLQLSDLAEEVAAALGPLLLLSAQRATMAPKVRAYSCAALAMLYGVLGETDFGECLQTMQAMEQIFGGAYVREGRQSGDGAGGGGEELVALRCAALAAWSLLLTQCPAGDLCQMVNGGSSALP